MGKVQLQYQLVGTEYSKVAHEVRALLAELKREGQLRSQARALGFDLENLDHTSISVESAGHGIDWTDVVVVTLTYQLAKASGKLSAVMLVDLWKKVLLPRIIQRVGEGTLIEQLKRNSTAPKKAKTRRRPKARK